MNGKVLDDYDEEDDLYEEDDIDEQSPGQYVSKDNSSTSKKQLSANKKGKCYFRDLPHEGYLNFFIDLMQHALQKQ